MFRILCYFLGVFMISLGTFLTILDANVLTLGYSFFHFVQFISRRSELYLILLGFVCLFFSLERWIKNELLLRRHLKLERGKNT